MANVRFLGAAGTVTGSCTLLEWKGEKILVDCGQFQGPEELEARNREPLPIAAREVTAVVLTHAHLDHTGRVPRLVADGYEGPIYCSKASKGLISLVLRDAAQLEEEAARYARKKGYSRHLKPEPLFTSRDVQNTLRRIHRLDFGVDHEILPGITLRLWRAGHLLGAASITIRAKGSDGQRRTWGFSGDVGRYGVPILKDPVTPDATLDGLVLESTYGDRSHVHEDPRDALRAAIDQTFDRGGLVLVPAFSLGRTQEVLFHLSALTEAGLLDPGLVYLDSPMADRATEIYRRAVSEHDEELLDLEGAGENPLDPSWFHVCRSPSASKELNHRQGPAVIVAGSGMANGGRIVHHLLHHLGDPRNAVLFVGFQAAGTRGRALVDGADTVAIHGIEVPVRAEIRYLPMLSAHADRNELLQWGRELPEPPHRVFLNHGEDPARKALAASLQANLGWPRPILPEVGTTVPW